MTQISRDGTTWCARSRRRARGHRGRANATAALAEGVELLWESDWEAVARLGRIVVIPDALVTVDHAGSRARAFIEADRATERHQAFAAKVRRYVDLYLRDDWRADLDRGS
jgi:hypothetical protein